jgi:hypothetical protein
MFVDEDSVSLLSNFSRNEKDEGEGGKIFSP